jgi:hypothetical protein
VLPSEDGRSWLAFVDSFFKVREFRRYLRTYMHILASPTHNTLALAQESDLAEALHFLQIRLLIFTLLVTSQIITGGLVVSQLVIPLLLVVTMGNYMGLFYELARSKSPRQRSGRDFLILCSYQIGFTMPVATALQAFQLRTRAPWLLWSSLIVLIIVSPPLYVYFMRIWAEFWELPKRKVLLYAFIAAMVQTAIGFLFVFSVVFAILMLKHPHIR